MKFIIVFAAVCIAVSSAGLADLRKLPATAHVRNIDLKGQFDSDFETAEGIRQIEKGYLVPNAKGDGEVLVRTGTIKYVGDDGVVYSVKYTADANGYRVEGAHLPTPVPPQY